MALLEKIQTLKQSIFSADKTQSDQVIKDLYSQIKIIEKDYKRQEKINNKYGVFFDKVISDGQNPEEAGRELKLL